MTRRPRLTTTSYRGRWKEDPMRTLRNCTLHALDIQLEDGRVLHLQVDGGPPTLEVVKEDLQAIRVSPEVEVPLVRSALATPMGLPDPKEGVILVVPAAAAEHPALAWRDDLAYPGEPVRDTNGTVIGVKGLYAGPGLAAITKIAIPEVKIPAPPDLTTSGKTTLTTSKPGIKKPSPPKSGRLPTNLDPIPPV